MLKIVTVLGARPQFVKAAPLSRALSATRQIQEIIVHTGQHYDSKMSDIFFDELGIPKPRHYLGIGSGQHGAQTGRMLEAVETILLAEKPDWVLVYGDTNSTLAGALAAAKLGIPVAHVEAGLRSFNRSMPEEINRVLTDQVSDLLFSPTLTATEHLRREGIRAETIHQVGDVMFDSVLQNTDLARQKSDILKRLNLQSDEFVLATIHRASNTDDPALLGAILRALGELSTTHEVVFPVHPRTSKMISGMMADMKASPSTFKGLRLIEPVGYLDMLMLEESSSLIVTDSGGVQKEAFFLRTPCVTLRTETEWTETIESGWNRLVSPSDSNAMISAFRAAIGSTGREVTPYGDGRAAEKIAAVLIRSMRRDERRST